MLRQLVSSQPPLIRDTVLLEDLAEMPACLQGIYKLLSLAQVLDCISLILLRRRHRLQLIVARWPMCTMTEPRPLVQVDQSGNTKLAAEAVGLVMTSQCWFNGQGLLGQYGPAMTSHFCFLARLWLTSLYSSLDRTHQQEADGAQVGGAARLQSQQVIKRGETGAKCKRIVVLE